MRNAVYNLISVIAKNSFGFDKTNKMPVIKNIGIFSTSFKCALKYTKIKFVNEKFINSNGYILIYFTFVFVRRLGHHT